MHIVAIRIIQWLPASPSMDQTYAQTMSKPQNDYWYWNANQPHTPYRPLVMWNLRSLVVVRDVVMGICWQHIYFVRTPFAVRCHLSSVALSETVVVRRQVVANPVSPPPLSVSPDAHAKPVVRTELRLFACDSPESPSRHYPPYMNTVRGAPQGWLSAPKAHTIAYTQRAALNRLPSGRMYLTSPASSAFRVCVS